MPRAAAVEQSQVAHAVEPEQPETEARVPVAAIAVEDDRLVALEPDATPQPPHRVSVWDVARDRVLKIDPPVQTVRPRHVAEAIHQRTLVRLEHDHIGVAEPLLQPRPVDKDRVPAHGSSCDR